MKRISIILALLLSVCALSACNEKKARSYDEIVSDIVSSEAENNEKNTQNNRADLNFEIVGKSVSIPFDYNLLVQSGYTIVDSAQEKQIYDAVNQKIPLVVMTNANEKQEELYGNPYINVDLYCGSQSKDSMNDISVVGFTLQTVEKKYMSINGFGWNDNTADFMKTIKQDYVEEVGTYKDNINSGDYVVLYTYSDLMMRVHSTEGKIRIIEVTTVQ